MGSGYHRREVLRRSRSWTGLYDEAYGSLGYPLQILYQSEQVCGAYHVLPPSLHMDPFTSVRGCKRKEEGRRVWPIASLSMGARSCKAACCWESVINPIPADQPSGSQGAPGRRASLVIQSTSGATHAWVYIGRTYELFLSLEQKRGYIRKTNSIVMCFHEKAETWAPRVSLREYGHFACSQLADK